MTAAKPISSRVLVVDDDGALRALIRDMLRRKGCEVTVASNGRLAVEQVHANGQFELIIMDYQMPEMDGLDACRIMHEHAPQIPIVMMSAEHVSPAVKKAGATGFLPKPFDPGDLLNCVSKYIDTDTEA